MLYLQLTSPCRRYFMQYDDLDLLTTTWSNMTIFEALLCEAWKYISTGGVIYEFFLHVVLGEHVRLCLWHYMCCVGVESWLFLLVHTRLRWLHWWCYDSIQDDLKMLGLFLCDSIMTFIMGKSEVCSVLSCLTFVLSWCIYDY